MTHLSRSLAILACLLTGAASAQYGASATVSLDVGDLEARDVNGSTFYVYDATVTWSGSCAQGDNNGYGGGLQGSQHIGDAGGEDHSSGGMSGSGVATFTNIQAGTVIRGHGYASCSDNGGSESDDAYTAPVVLPTHIADRPMIFTESPAEFFTCLPIGTEVLLHHDWSSMGLDDEEIEISFKGAGIDYTQRIPMSETGNLEVRVKATSSGPVEYTRTNLGTWNGAQVTSTSNVFTLQADTHQACTTTPGSGNEEEEEQPGPVGGNPDGDGSDEEASGCTSIPGSSGLLLLTLFGAVWRRRRPSSR